MQGVQGALLDHLREGVQGERLPQEVFPCAQTAMQADPGQGGEEGKEPSATCSNSDLYVLNLAEYQIDQSNLSDSQDKVQVGPHQEMLRRSGLRAQKGVQTLPQDGLPQGSRPG